MRRRDLDRDAGARGTTFLELLLVAAVLSIFSAAVLPTGRTVHRRVQEKELKGALARIRAAIDEYHTDWEQGFIESDDELGWPESLEELHEETEFTPPQQIPMPTAGSLPRSGKQEKTQKIYLKHLPVDPFNRDGNEWDTSGWRARGYEDDWDSSSWNGVDLYQVYSASPLQALDGSRYEDW